MEKRGARTTKARQRKFGHLTPADILSAHLQFGALNYQLVKRAMGPNWPEEWNRLGPGQGIFAEEGVTA